MALTTSTRSKSTILAEYPVQFVVCRQGQHRWPPFNQWHWRVTLGFRKKPLEYRVDLTCEICGKTAHDKIDANTGEKTRTYTDPPVPEGTQGYRIPADADVSRSDLRLEMLHRLASQAEVEPVKPEPVKALA